MYGVAVGGEHCVVVHDCCAEQVRGCLPIHDDQYRAADLPGHRLDLHRPAQPWHHYEASVFLIELSVL